MTPEERADAIFAAQQEEIEKAARRADDLKWLVEQHKQDAEKANTKRLKWIAENLKAVRQDIGENWLITHFDQNGAEIVTKSEHGFIDAVDRAMDQNPIKK